MFTKTMVALTVGLSAMTFSLPERFPLIYPTRHSDSREPSIRSSADQILVQAGVRTKPRALNQISHTVTSTTYGDFTWTSLGPSGFLGLTYHSNAMMSGRITAVAMDGQSLLVGTANGGIWRRAHGGKWQPISENAYNLAIGSIAVDPKNPRIIYAGTGSYGSNTYGTGILQSRDGGKTWSDLGSRLFRGQWVTSLVVNPTYTKVLYAATTAGVYKSTDAGLHWTLLGNLPTTYATALVMSPTHSDTLYAGLLGQGIYKTTNGGETWNVLSHGLPQGGFDTISLAIAPSDSNILYSAFSNSSNHELLGFYASTDAGQVWTVRKGTPPYFDETYYLGQAQTRGQGDYDNVIAIDPKNPLHVAVGGVTWLESYNGGRTWREPYLPFNSQTQTIDLHPDQHAMLFDTKGDFFLGNDGGIWERTPKHWWLDLNNGLSATQFYKGISTSVDGSIVVGGTQDNGIMQRKNGKWQQLFAGDAAYTAINPFDPSEMVGVVDGEAWMLYDDGLAYLPITPPNITRPSGSLTPLVMSSFTPNDLLFASDNRVYQTTSFGHKWKAVGRPLAAGRNSISALAWSTQNPNIIYAGTTDGHVFATFNDGKHWTPITPTDIPYLGSYLYQEYNPMPVTDIAIDPTDPKRIVITYGGYRLPATHRLVLENDDTGAKKHAWKNITGNLPLDGVQAIVAVGKSLYVGDNEGVFQGSFGSDHWNPYGKMPHDLVDELSIAWNDRLMAATLGLGVFETPSTVQGTTLTISAKSLHTGTNESLRASLGGLPLSTGVAWKTSNPDIAKVKTNGTLIAVKSGNVVLAARYEGFVAMKEIHVTKNLRKS